MELKKVFHRVVTLVEKVSLSLGNELFLSGLPLLFSVELKALLRSALLSCDDDSCL